MPLPYNVNASRDDITDILTSRADQSPAAQMAAAIPTNLGMPAATGAVPATPAGGVPGSGMPPGGPSNLALPPRPPTQQGMSLPLTGMGTMPELAMGGAPPQSPLGNPAALQAGMFGAGMPAGLPQGMPAGMTGMPQMPQGRMGRKPRLY